jgi:ribosomal protein S27E
VPATKVKKRVKKKRGYRPIRCPVCKKGKLVYDRYMKGYTCEECRRVQLDR